MFIPIGHEETSLRRLPWVTFGIMGLCLIALVATLAASSDEAAVDSDAKELSQYFMAHPYLDLSPALEDQVFPGMGEQKRRTLFDMMRAASRTPEDPAVLRAEQVEIDRLARRVEEGAASDPFERWGLVPARFGLLALFTHMFMHAGWLHLLGNLFILYLVGPYIEDVWGRPLYAAFYLAAGAAAAMAFVLQNPRLEAPLVGASGAIAGVMGAFLIRYWRTRIRFFYIVSPSLHGTFEAPAWAMLPLWFGQQLFMASMSTSGTGGGVAYLAHTGGFAFGAGGAWLIQQLQVESRWVHPRIESKVTTTHVHKPALDRALAARSSGNAVGAFDLMMEEAGRSPNDRDVALALWDVARELGRAPEAAPAMARAIRLDLKSAEPRLAYDHWRELRENAPNAQLEPSVLTRLAEVMAQCGDTREAVRTLRTAMLFAGADLEPDLALRIARVAKDLDVDVAQSAVRFALSRAGLDPAQRASAESLLAELNGPRTSIPVGT